MNDINESELANKSKVNIRIAIIFGLIAFSVSLLPFFYLANAVANG